MSATLIADPNAPLCPVTAVYVATDQGMVLVEAIVSGNFALHTTITSGNAGVQNPAASWTITHVASGRILAAAASKARGMMLIEGLTALRLDWNFRDLRVFRSWPREAVALVRTVILANGFLPPNAQTGSDLSNLRH